MIAQITPELEMAGWALAVMGVSLVTLSMIMGIRKKRRLGATRVTGREQLERMKQKKALRDDLEHVMVEVEQLAKRLGAQLDAKARMVEKLINEADERIERLNALAAEAGRDGRPEASVPPDDPPPSPLVDTAAVPQDGPADKLAGAVYELADAGHDAPAIARQLDEHVGKVELILALRSA